MELQIVNKEIAIQLKGLGFNWECERYYFSKDDTSNVDSTILLDDWNKRKDYKSAPTQALVCKWFRDTHKLHIVVWIMYNKWHIQIKDIVVKKYVTELAYFESYEEAEEYGIIKAIEILNNFKTEIIMLPTIEEQDDKYKELEQSTYTYKKVAMLYAKWYAEQVIKHCAEIAKCDWVRTNEGKFMQVDKQSVLNIINKL